MHTLIIGLDAFDPGIVERMLEAGKLPNLNKYARNNGYARFEVSNPPQSEVSWTSIATGLNPGGHGMFDFVHRDPASYALNVSLLPTKRTVLGTSFAHPHNAPTIFDQAAQEGYPATALWWPATFPAHLESPVQNIPGLGTPDVMGRLGVGAAYVVDPGARDEKLKTAVEPLKRIGKGRFAGVLKGPAQQKGNQYQGASLDFQLEGIDEHSARLILGKQALTLTRGKWSPIFEIVFKFGFLGSMHAITRVVMNQVEPEPSLYFLPLQIHPLHSPWPYATPPGFVKQTWNSCGSFLTLGWPQDTTGLEEKWITDDQFLQLCDSIFTTRRNIFLYHLKSFDEGLFANIFDSLDRVQHMFLRDRPDVIESWYQKFDDLVGLAGQLAASKSWKNLRTIVVSDHGFSRFDHKVHLNRWLLEHGYIVLKPDGEDKNLGSVDWSKTRAYAAGLNSLYLNLQDRESEGCVAPAQSETLSEEIRKGLLALKGPDGRKAVQQVYLQKEAFEGSLAGYGPDLLVGYAPGYRASSQTGLGNWEDRLIEPNTDHWGADHCIAPEAVPGVLFCNQDLGNYPHPSYRDIPALTIGKNVEKTEMVKPPPTAGNEDQKIVEERLKSLGYLLKTRRLPPGDLLLAFGAIAFPIHVWAIVNILIVFPAWFIRLSIWELAGAISYPLVTALLESGLLWLVLLGLSFVLPKKWLADKFAALSSLIVWLLSAWVMLAQFIFVHILQWDLGFKIGGLVLVVASIALTFWLVHHFERLEGWIKKLAQNLAVLTYLYIFFDLLGLVVIILRNL